MEDFKFTAEENSFIIEADGKKLRVSYEEELMSWKDAKEFCKKNGGGDESVDNLRLLAKYRESINKELEALGKNVLRGWLWSNELGYVDAQAFAFVVFLSYGYVVNDGKNDDIFVRTVSAL